MSKKATAPAHTPGTWNYEPQISPDVDEYLTFAIVTEGAKREFIAMIPAEERPKKTTRANARLIAAAPDLLMACEHLLFVTAKVEGFIASAARETATKAIAKAYGKAA